MTQILKYIRTNTNTSKNKHMLIMLLEWHLEKYFETGYDTKIDCHGNIVHQLNADTIMAITHDMFATISFDISDIADEMVVATSCEHKIKGEFYFLLVIGIFCPPVILFMLYRFLVSKKLNYRALHKALDSFSDEILSTQENQ